MTDADILAALREREIALIRCPSDRPLAELLALIAPDFQEIGASGQVHDAASALAYVKAGHEAADKPDWPTDEFAVRKLGEGLYLLTYRLDRPDRPTRRSSIWRQAGDDWQMMFHQGTLVG